MAEELGGNLGLWLNADGSIGVRQLEVPALLRPDDVLVKVLYSGVNPADTKHVTLGIHSTVTGYDFCGEVIRAGPNAPFSVGDVIAGATPTGVNRPIGYGAHQNYLLCPNDGTAFRVPEGMPRHAAACVSVVVRAAADAFFDLLGFPLIGEGKHAELPHSLLIWGGTSAVGLSVLQFARQLGVPTILTTAPCEYHEMLATMGATKCFDYRDADVVDQIRKEVGRLDTPLRYVMDAVGVSEDKTADLAASCAAPDAKVVTMTVHPKYPMPFSQLHMDTELEIEHRGRIVIPKRPRDAVRVQAMVDWVVVHYGRGFEFPKISTFSGQVDLARSVVMPRSVLGGDFGKKVLTHPLQH